MGQMSTFSYFFRILPNLSPKNTIFKRKFSLPCSLGIIIPCYISALNIQFLLPDFQVIGCNMEYRLGLQCVYVHSYVEGGLGWSFQP